MLHYEGLFIVTKIFFSYLHELNKTNPDIIFQDIISVKLLIQTQKIKKIKIGQNPQIRHKSRIVHFEILKLVAERNDVKLYFKYLRSIRERTNIEYVISYSAIEVSMVVQFKATLSLQIKLEFRGRLQY